MTLTVQFPTNLLTMYKVVTATHPLHGIRWPALVIQELTDTLKITFFKDNTNNCVNKTAVFNWTSKEISKCLTSDNKDLVEAAKLAINKDFPTIDDEILSQASLDGNDGSNSGSEYELTIDSPVMIDTIEVLSETYESEDSESEDSGVASGGDPTSPLDCTIEGKGMEKIYSIEENGQTKRYRVTGKAEWPHPDKRVKLTTIHEKGEKTPPVSKTTEMPQSTTAEPNQSQSTTATPTKAPKPTNEAQPSVPLSPIDHSVPPIRHPASDSPIFRQGVQETETLIKTYKESMSALLYVMVTILSRNFADAISSKEAQFVPRKFYYLKDIIIATLRRMKNLPRVGFNPSVVKLDDQLVKVFNQNYFFVNNVPSQITNIISSPHYAFGLPTTHFFDSYDHYDYNKYVIVNPSLFLFTKDFCPDPVMTLARLVSIIVKRFDILKSRDPRNQISVINNDSISLLLKMTVIHDSQIIGRLMPYVFPHIPNVKVTRRSLDTTSRDPMVLPDPDPLRNTPLYNKDFGLPSTSDPMYIPRSPRLEDANLRTKDIQYTLLRNMRAEKSREKIVPDSIYRCPDSQYRLNMD